VAFILKLRSRLCPGVTAGDVCRATDYVLPCFEIVDSRIRDWRNQDPRHGRRQRLLGVFVLSGAHRTAHTCADWICRFAGMVVEKNGDIASTSAGAASRARGQRGACANTLGPSRLPLKAARLPWSVRSPADPVPWAGDSFTCSGRGLGTCRFVFPESRSMNTRQRLVRQLAEPLENPSWNAPAQSSRSPMRTHTLDWDTPRRSIVDSRPE